MDKFLHDHIKFGQGCDPYSCTILKRLQAHHSGVYPHCPFLPNGYKRELESTTVGLDLHLDQCNPSQREFCLNTLDS